MPYIVVIIAATTLALWAFFRTDGTFQYRYIELRLPKPAGEAAYLDGIEQYHNGAPAYAILFISAAPPDEMLMVETQGRVMEFQDHSVLCPLDRQAIYALQVNFSLKQVDLSASESQKILATLKASSLDSVAPDLNLSLWKEKVLPNLSELTIRE